MLSLVELRITLTFKVQQNIALAIIFAHTKEAQINFPKLLWNVLLIIIINYKLYNTCSDWFPAMFASG